MRAVILAAGEGTRLHPLTATCPKPMLPIAGKPLLEHTLAWLSRHRIREVAINLYHKAETVTTYFGDGASFGLALRYSRESILLGTAGALRPLCSFLDETFAIVYGDVLTDLNLESLLDVHRRMSAIATLSLYHVPNPTDCGIVDLAKDGRVLRLVEKPSPDQVFGDLAFSGVLIAEPEMLAAIPDTPFSDLGFHVFPRLLETGRRVYGLPITSGEYLVDIGSHEKYAAACREWPSRTCW